MSNADPPTDPAIEANGQRPASSPPSAWVQRFFPLIPPGGAVLDLACGSGRHARLLAAAGYQVEAVDQDGDALATLNDIPRIVPRLADLEGGPWPYYGRSFQGVVVTHYLFRPLMPQILNALAPGGVLIYETFMTGNERFGRPSNPAHLLRRGELLDLVRNRLMVVAFEQGEVEAPRPAVIQRICALRDVQAVVPPG